MTEEIAVIYDARSLEILRIIIPDHQHQLDDPSLVQSGEALLRIAKPDFDRYYDTAAFHAHIASIIATASGRLK